MQMITILMAVMLALVYKSPRAHKSKHETTMACSLLLESVHNNNTALLMVDNYVYLHLAISMMHK